MVFHHRRYAGELLQRDALATLLPRLTRPRCTLTIRTRGGVDTGKELSPRPDHILQEISRPGSATRFVTIEAGGDVVARTDRDGLVLLAPGPWLDDLEDVPHEQVAWSWLLLQYGGEGDPPPLMRRAERAVLHLVHRAGEASTIRRLGLCDVDLTVEAFIDRPGARAGRLSRSRQRVMYSKPWIDTGDLNADAQAWWNSFVKKVNPSADTEHLLRYSLTEADSLGLTPDDVEDAIDDAVAAHGGETDNPTETGDFLEIPVIGCTTAGHAAAIKALHDLGLTSAHDA